MNLEAILHLAVHVQASDIHFKAGMPPIFRLFGELKPLVNISRLTPEDIKKIAYSIMSETQKVEFLKKHEADFAYTIPKLARFRVNVFQQRQSVGMVFRVIPLTIKTLEQLAVPSVLEKIADEKNGLVLVTGPTGSGKSTTLAALIEQINTYRSCNIITIEDPIEFAYQDKRSIISQREVGTDTNSFPLALRAALRQDPDVIMVGEMRDTETIETALLAAETGHLVMSTLHTIDVMETINRILAVFSIESQQQIRLQLSSVIRAIISMRLVLHSNGKGRVPAMEIMLTSSRIRECIREPQRTREIPLAMKEAYETYKMQTFDQSLADLLSRGIITKNEALKNSSNIQDFGMKLDGVDGVNTQESPKDPDESVFEQSTSKESLRLRRNREI